MAPPLYGVDDPKFLNDFLAMIGASPLPVKEEVPKPNQVQPSFTGIPGSTSTDEETDAEDDFHSPESDPDLFNDENDEDEEEFGGTPEKTQHRQSTIDTYYAAVANTALKRSAASPDLIHDAPLHETELPEFFAKMSDPKSSLEDSKYAPRQLYNKIPSRYPVIAARRPNTNTGGSVNKLDYPQERPRTRTTVQQEMLDKIAAREAKEAAGKLAPAPSMPAAPAASSTYNLLGVAALGSPFEEEVIAKFKARAEVKEKGKENVKTAPAPVIAPKALDPSAMEWTYPADTPSYTLEEGQAQFAKSKEVAIDAENAKAGKTKVAEVTTTKNVAEAADIDAPVDFKPVEINVTTYAISTTPVKASTTQTMDVTSPIQSAQATLKNAKADLVAKTVELATNKEPGSPEEGSSMVVTSSEDPTDRENATHFTSWGTPQARTTPRAKVRKVVLRAVPASADLTFVQSVISGGAIDNFALGANGTAQVTFTTPEACDAYCNKYPNGVVIKFKGRNIVLFVEKTTEVNVVSGMLQGQLEAGASRCVRAVGADHDWGMGALIKLAEGKTRKGKVEHIADTWRNEIRTVIFRFTSIGDAVTFKSMLVRQEDWEGCNIQFMDDPCEKATGVRAE